MIVNKLGPTEHKMKHKQPAVFSEKKINSLDEWTRNQSVKMLPCFIELFIKKKEPTEIRISIEITCEWMTWIGPNGNVLYGH